MNIRDEDMGEELTVAMIDELLARVRTDAEIIADFRRVRGEHFARLAEEPLSSEAWDTLGREIADEQHTLGELLAATDALAARGGGA